MARLIHIRQQHPAVAALARTGQHFKATAVGALLLVLVTLGSVALRAGSVLQHTFVAWAEARQQRDDARSLREAAQADPRVMADLIALQQHAQN